MYLIEISSDSRIGAYLMPKRIKSLILITERGSPTMFDSIDYLPGGIVASEKVYP